MTKPAKKTSTSYESAQFVLEAADLSTANSFGFLRDDTPINTTDSKDSNYGVAHDKKRNIGSDTYATRQGVHQRCKQFAETYGFQIIVSSSSSANAKYTCKHLNGQQFFDDQLSHEFARCPFFVNVSGGTDAWQPTKANFCHNHLKNVGFSRMPFVEGKIARPAKAQRNTTRQSKRAQALAESKMPPAHNGRINDLTGSAISTFLLSEGMTLSTAAISRIKTAIGDKLKCDRLLSY